MAVMNYAGEEINAKIVYYGPGLGGKTTNLETIYSKMPAETRGKMVSMKTRTDRTLFFDFLPIEFGNIQGYRTRFLLYTVPGQVYYNATRKLVLKGVDAVVFVADSSREKLHENIESLRNLEDNLNELGLSLDTLPWVIQYNKRDLPDAMPVNELEERLNLIGVPAFEASAARGVGVYDTFQGIAQLLYTTMRAKLDAGEIEQAADEAPVTPLGAGAVLPRVSRDAQRPEESDQAVDSMLREVKHDAPSPVKVPAPAPAKARTAAPSPSPSPARANPARLDRVGPGGMDGEVGRVLSLDDAVEASNAVRNQEPGEFITGPSSMTRDDEKAKGASKPVPEKAAPVKPAPRAQRVKETLPAPAPAPRVEPVAVAAPPRPQPPATAETREIVVPVVITRSQVRKAVPLRFVLDIQVLDD